MKFKNKAIMECRQEKFCRSHMLLAKNIKRRYDMQKDRGRKYVTELPSNVSQAMSEEFRRPSLFNTSIATINSDRTYATVNSVRCPGKRYRVHFAHISDANEKYSSGIRSVNIGYPCVHQLVVTRALDRT